VRFLDKQIFSGKIYFLEYSLIREVEKLAHLWLSYPQCHQLKATKEPMSERKLFYGLAFLAFKFHISKVRNTANYSLGFRKLLMEVFFYA